MHDVNLNPNGGSDSILRFTWKCWEDNYMQHMQASQTGTETNQWKDFGLRDEQNSTNSYVCHLRTH